MAGIQTRWMLNGGGHPRADRGQGCDLDLKAESENLEVVQKFPFMLVM